MANLNVSKYERLKNAVEQAKKSQSKESFRQLVTESVIVFRQGSGLLWSDLEEILNETFES